MKKITSAALALSLLAAVAVSGCATPDGGSGGVKSGDGKDREISTGTRIPQR